MSLKISNTLVMPHPRVRAFFYGATGSGKTTAAATFPTPLFLTPANEGSELTLTGRSFDYIRLGLDDNGRPIGVRAHMTTVLGELEARFTKALKAKSDEEALALFPWETIVFESLTHYGDLLVEDIGQQGSKTMDQQSWGAFATHLRTVYNRLNSLDCHVVLTALEKVQVTDDKRTVGGPNFSGSMAIKLPSACDLIGYCVATPKSAKDTAYRVHFRQHGPFAARSRFTGFPPFVDNFDFSDVERFFVGTKNS